jgi:hypothetical protein
MRDLIDLLSRRSEPLSAGRPEPGVAATGRPSDLLRLEDAAGRPFDPIAAVEAHWQRPPYALAIRLVRHAPGTTAGETLDEAVIGTRGPRRQVRDRIEATAARMWRDVERGQARGPSCATPPPALAAGWRARAGAWLRRGGERLGEKLLVEWWSVGRASADLEAIVAGCGLGPIAWAEPRSGASYLADPFPWPGTDHLLAEEMPTAGGRGRIIVAEPQADGTLRRAAIVLEDDAHHSYPCPFEDGGAVYLLPETPEPGRTTLYRIDAAGRLDPVCRVAPRRHLADPTLFRWGGLYWIACTDLEIGAHDNLCLLHADRLEGPWRTHRLDPVRLDVRGARPAGPVFTRGTALFRPGQDCARGYGAAVVLHRIEALSPEAFSETPVAILRPDRGGPFPHGLHTFSVGDGCVWVDGKRLVLDPRAVARKLLAKLGSGRARGRREEAPAW